MFCIIAAHVLKLSLTTDKTSNEGDCRSKYRVFLGHLLNVDNGQTVYCTDAKFYYDPTFSIAKSSSFYSSLEQSY